MGLWIGRFLGLIFLAWSLSGCGEVTFFFFVNTGTLDDRQASGLVVVVGTPREPEPESVQLVSGLLPRGMEIHPDATVQGIPEESGTFEFILEVTEVDGSTEELHFQVEVEE